MGLFIGIYRATKNVTSLTPAKPEDHLNRIAENQMCLHYTANRLIPFMENNRRLFSESYVRHIYSMCVNVVTNTSTLISSLVNKTFGEMLVVMQI